MERYHVGLDAHSKQSVFVIENIEGKIVGVGSVQTILAGLRGMRDRFALPEGTQVALESGTVAFFVARQLKGLGLEPVVVDAHEVRLKAHRPN